MIGFSSPLILLALVAVPVLWFLLRAIPPAPITRRFPGVALLLGLSDDNRQAARTPWWLLLLRIVAVTAAILGFAGPVLNPADLAPNRKPLLILMDGGWAEAADWPRRLAKVQSLLDGAERQGRPVALALLTDPPQAPVFLPADQVRGRVAGLAPRPWLPVIDPIAAPVDKGKFDTVWLSDGLAHPGRGMLSEALLGHGALTVLQGDGPVTALLPTETEAGKLKVQALRSADGTAEVVARGPDPSGQDRELARAALGFSEGKATALLDLPPELRNRVTRLVIEGPPSAGMVALAGEALKRRKVALVSDAAEGEGLQLLDPLHYLRQALQPSADLIEGAVADVVPAKPDVIVLADVATLPAAEAQALKDWVEKGGLLLRFAGPRLAAADMAELAGDPLMPVHLRQGGLTSGGAMSWGDPKRLAPFPEASPFRGLALPAEVTVKTQVLAEPGPELAGSTLAALEDGTPLVTRTTLGAGQVVLVHVTANAEWSDLPLSGLFVQMLDRLAVTAGGAAAPGALAGLTWAPRRVMDGFGTLSDAWGRQGVAGADLERALKDGPGAGTPPGLYQNEGRTVALNAVPAGFQLVPEIWTSRVTLGDLSLPREQALKGPFLAAALALLLVDILASLAVSGRLAARVAVALIALALPHDARADDDFALAATEGVVLAHVTTGDAQVDDIAQAGLQGLSDELAYRTAVEPLTPMAVDVEKDELAFFPFLYWPVTAEAKAPSEAAYAKLNRYLRTGGMILFDTRDAEYGSGSPEAAALQRIAAGLDIPPLEPIPDDHVLTRTFYLLQTFPGRFTEGTLWVEAAPPDAAQAEGMPFRNLNDGVTPVVIGANDYASAWAVDGEGAPMLPVGRGLAGDEQREYAYRFGINLIMHVLTGNYKSDQVHVPALLERLGQ